MAEADSGWDDWVALQQAYWERWSEIGRQAMGLETPPVDPWQQAMEHWWSAVAPAVPEPYRDTVERMLAQSGRAFALVREAGQGWEAMVERLGRDFQDALSAGAGAGDQGQWGALLGLWSMPQELWRQASEGLMPPQAGAIPPFPGLDRESLARQQELTRLWTAWQQALQAYHQFFADLGARCVERMGERLRRRDDDDRPIESVRALYDEWTEVCESVYGERVATPEYARLHGGLVDATMGLKRHLGETLDRQAGQLGLPTRRGLRTLQQRVQQDRRELRELRAEVEALRRELADLREERSSATAPKRTAPGRKKGVTRKKTVKKKAATRKKTTARRRAPGGGS